MTDLYRAYDETGRLLYVGISLRVWERLAQHKKHSGWYSRLLRLEVASLPSREAAEQAEIDAIKNERPLFNQTHAGGLASKVRLSAPKVHLISWRAAPVHAGVDGANS